MTSPVDVLGTDQELRGAMRELLVRQQIGDVLHRYCRGIDREERDVVRSCWHVDGTADYGDAFCGTADEFLEWAWPINVSQLAHSHQVSSVVVDVDVAAERATSEAYATTWNLFVPDGATDPSGAVETSTKGRYLDRWSRRDGIWAIDHRRYVMDLRSMTDVRLGGGAAGA